MNVEFARHLLFADGRMIACTVCKTISKDSEWITPGSVLTELFLWLLCLIPGIIYSVWRSNAAIDVCPACYSTAIVPLDSPAGQEIQRAFPVLPKPTDPPISTSESRADCPACGKTLDRLARFCDACGTAKEVCV